MTKHTYRVLEFPKLLNILSNYASCPLGQSDCLALNPSIDLHAIDHEQKLVSEKKLLLQVKGFLSFDGLIDIEPLLRDSRAEGAHLAPEGLLSIYLTSETSRHSKKIISSSKSLCPGLWELVKEMPLCEELGSAIKRAIAPNGSVNDSASPELKKTRRKKTHLRRALQSKLENIKGSKALSSGGDDCLVTIRQGRYVMTLRTDMKNRVPGIIHDYSHSQATCFFEPIEVVQDNNRIAELMHLEKEEELRILSKLTSLVKDNADDLLVAQTLLAKLDGLSARAKLSNALNGLRPIMNQEGIVELRQAQNPILLSLSTEGSSPVPVDILLNRDVNVMIISGPNRGGKTVTLKTLGMLSLMAQSGLHIPAAEGSRLPVFKKIMAEIGDDQDIQSGLSTFSAHVSHLKSMMAHADKDTLVIIDEPGMGTDPDQGSALAMAVMDDLSRKDALVAVSTHYNRLKTYGLLNDRAKNASMEFDASTNLPTFFLRYGTPGTSYAFEIALDSGIKQQVIDRATGYLDMDEVRLNRLIDKLSNLKRETAQEKTAAEATRREYLSAKEKISQAFIKLELEKREILEKKRTEADLMIKEAREEFSNLINSLRNRRRLSQAHAKQRLDELSENLWSDISNEEEVSDPIDISGFKVGQHVRHRKHHQEGTIISIDKAHSRALVVSGNVKLTVHLKELEMIPTGTEESPEEVSESFFGQISGYSGSELNLIGCRVGDALPLIDKMIDRAILEGSSTLRIIHGYGTGRLKRAIREYLKNYPCVKSICGANPQSGGEAITLVELR